MLSNPTHYRIKVRGVLPPNWADYWGNLQLSTAQGNSVLSGIIVDQAALHGHLAWIRDLGLPLLLVEQVEKESLS
ncbi:MAG: hypothetical protein ACPG8W_14305 [Candidatus Promineifilaceae bacterium]